MGLKALTIVNALKKCPYAINASIGYIGQEHDLKPI